MSATNSYKTVTSPPEQVGAPVCFTFEERVAIACALNERLKENKSWLEMMPNDPATLRAIKACESALVKINAARGSSL